MDKLAILWHYWRAKHGLRFGGREELLRWQDRQVRNLLREILPKSLFYRKALGHLDPRAWREFPVITKSDMMEAFDALNTVGVSRERAFEVALRAEKERDFTPTINGITVGLSSGTSGSRGLFLVSARERCQWAGAVLAKVLPGSILSRHKIAFFLRANSNLYTSVAGRNIEFRFFDLQAGVEAHINKLHDFAPSLLIAPPFVLQLLGQAREEGALGITPEKIVSVAEVLDPLAEASLTRQFGRRIHQVYQATEGFLGATCAHGTLHLNEDVLVVQKEYLDRSQGKFVPIITDFSRTAQPIIRYRLNDILTERGTPCPCGSVFTALEKVDGRCDDIFYLPARKGARQVAVFPDYVSRAVMCAHEGITDYKVVQTSPGRVEVFLRVRPQEAARYPEVKGVVALALISLFERHGAVAPEIHFCDRPTADPAKKCKRIERLVAP